MIDRAKERFEKRTEIDPQRDGQKTLNIWSTAYK